MGEDDDKTKIQTTLRDETVVWLREHYPDTLSDQEAMRCAISDARLLRERGDVVIEEEAGEHAD